MAVLLQNGRAALFSLYFTFAFFSPGSAQKVLSVEPVLGVQVPYARYDKAIGKAATFRPRNFDVVAHFGLLLQLKTSDRWRFASGVSYGATGWGYRLTVPDNLLKSPYRSPEAGHHTAVNTVRFPLQVNYTLKDNIHFGTIDAARQLFAVVFRLHGTAGVSVDWVPTYNPGGLNIGTTFYYGDTIAYREQEQRLRTFGASLYLGGGIQFYHRGKDLLSINLYFNQGLVDLFSVDVHYQLNSDQHYTRLLTRGTLIGASASLPIRLKTFPTRNQREIYKR